MYKDVLQSIKNIDTLAIISLIIFILLFAIIIVRLLRMNNDHLIKMKQLPLEPENNSQNLKGE
jgi:hypothetical protein